MSKRREEEPGRIKPEDHVALADNIRFAKQLGAQVVKLKGSRVADALVEFAKREGITHVIFGQSARSRWDLLMHGSIVDRFLRDVRDATVQIVPVAQRSRGGRGHAGRIDRDETANQTAARLRRLRAGARRARRVERPHAQPDERGVRPHHRRELRLGGRRAGHEGKPRAAGFGGAVRAARRSTTAPAARSPSIARGSTPPSTRPRPTSPSRASARSSTPSAAAATTTIAASTRFSLRPAIGPRRYFGDLEPRFNAVRADCDRLLRLNQEAMRRKADDASRDRAALAVRHARAGDRLDGRRHRRRSQPVERDSRPGASADRRDDAGGGRRPRRGRAGPVRRTRSARSRPASTAWRSGSASCGRPTTRMSAG